MNINEQRLDILKFICKILGIKTPSNDHDIAIFCIMLKSTPTELHDFNSSTEYSVPASWLDVLFLKMTSSQFEEYAALTLKICAPLKEPVFYRGIGGHSTASRPDYEVPRSDPNYRVPYKRKVSPTETITKRVLKDVGKSPTAQEFPTQQRLNELVQMAINCSEKDGTVNRYLFKKVLSNMIPNTYTINTSPLKTILINKVTSTKSEFPFKEKVEFI